MTVEPVQREYVNLPALYEPVPCVTHLRMRSILILLPEQSERLQVACVRCCPLTSLRPTR